MTDVIVRIVNETVVVKNDASELLTPLVVAAEEAADAADASADAAAASAAAAATAAFDQTEELTVSIARAATIGLGASGPMASFLTAAREHDFAADSFRDGLTTTNDMTTLAGWSFARASTGLALQPGLQQHGMGRR
jgi:hypothetical protein